MDTQNFQNRIDLERVHMLHVQLNEAATPFYAWLAALLTVLVISGANFLGIAIWVVLLLTVEIFQAVFVKKYFSLKIVNTPLIWEKNSALFLLLESVVISAGVMVLINLDQYLATYMALTLIMIPAFISALNLVASSRAHDFWVVGLLLPIVVKLLLSDDPLYWVFGLATLIAAIPTAIMVGNKLNESFISTLKLRFENADLLRDAQTAREKAEKASADKTRFLASASHDLRQPVHALELFSDALEHKLNEPDQFELMSKMKESTVAINDLLGSLLDISKLDAGIITVDKKAVSITQILEKLIKAIKPQADIKGVTILFNAEPHGVYSDAILLESMLHNLLSNALKYTDNDGSIDVLYSETNGKAKISIKDTGIGISDADKENIFNEFFQVDNPERDRIKGLGLGLAIVKRTCQLLDHQLEMESTLGEGSVFTLTLNTAALELIEESSQPILVKSKLCINVVVIDDEHSILEGMEKMLQTWGCNVLSATSLKEALQLLDKKKENIDLIICDYRLAKGKLGTDAVVAVQQTQPEKIIPAIIITGDTGPEQLKDINRSQYHVLHKPVAPIRMRALIQSLGLPN